MKARGTLRATAVAAAAGARSVKRCESIVPTPSDLRSASTASLLERVRMLSAVHLDTDSEHTWELIHELQRRPEPAVLRAGVEWCRSEASALKVLGADMLAQLGVSERPFRVETLAALEPLLQDPDTAVLAAAATAHGHLGPVPETSGVFALCRHNDAKVRQAVAYALGGGETPSAVATLILLSRDSDRDVRNWATFGIGAISEMDTPGIRDALLERLSESDVEIRGEALLGLARLKDPRGLAPLIEELSKQEFAVLALDAAEEYGSPELVPVLRKLADSLPDEEQVQEALLRCQRQEDA